MPPPKKKNWQLERLSWLAMLRVPWARHKKGESQSLDVAILHFRTARAIQSGGRIYTFLFSSRGSLVIVVPTMEVTISAGMVIYLFVSFLAGKGDVSLLVVLENPRSMS